MSKATADRHQRQLVALLKEPGNDQCADCKARNPRWASWDQGVFLCVQCASMHRKIGSHITKVKSVTLDTWTREQVDNMKRLGNTRANALLNPDERRHPPPPADSGNERNSELERFIRNKYEYRAFANVAPPAPAPASNGHTNGAAFAPTVTSPPPPRRAPSATPSFAPPPTDPPVPALPSRPRSRTAPSSSAFDDFSSFLSAPPPAATAAPTLPPRPPASAPPVAPKSVRFPELPPTVIPSPPDSEDEDEAPLARVRPTGRTRSASAPPPRKGALRVRPGGANEILVDWAAFTRDSALDADADEDVPLGTLGALGARGAQVGMVGVPQAQGAWAVPYGQPGAAGGGAPAYAQGPGMGAGQATVAPLLPQYTGSAKGYLHQQRTAQPPAPLQQQATGIDAFQQMFQPPQAQAPPAAASPNPFLRQQQPAIAPPQGQAQASYFPPQGPQQQQFAHPQPRTNPFHAHLFARNAYSPSPQPWIAPTPSPQPPQPQQQRSANDIWADLDLLGGPPQPAFHGYGGGSGANTPSPTLFGAPTPSPSFAQQPHAPAPLRPQLTGFVPSSSFGQQLARETGGGGGDGSGGGTPSLLQVPPANGPPSPAPTPLRPQLTGFVPSSAFGQELLRSGGSPAPSPTPQQQQPPAQALQPQRTGFVPSSRFGLELGGGPVNGNGGGAVEPAPFDFPSPSPAASGAQPPPLPPTQGNPFANFGAALGGALTPASSVQAQAQAQGQGRDSPNPFFLRQQVTGFAPPTQQQQQQQYAGGGGFLRPQVTGFAGTPGGGNPFLTFQQQQQQRGEGWR